MYEWGFGPQPDEWVDTEWFDADGNYHDISELGELRKPAIVEEMDTEDIPF